MVQELYVLKCFSCNIFQSHIVKKSNKWQCKVCGSKQSLKKVYGQGSGKDCRIHTQKLNALKGEKESENQVDDGDTESSHSYFSYITKDNSLPNNGMPEQPLPSKWDMFLERDETSEQKRSHNDQTVSNIRAVIGEKYANTKRSFGVSQLSVVGAHTSSERLAQLDNTYSDSSFSNSSFPSKKAKNVKRCGSETYQNDLTENTVPLPKYRKLTNERTESSTSLKWSKYLEPDKLASVQSVWPTQFHSGNSGEDLPDNDIEKKSVFSEYTKCEERRPIRDELTFKKEDKPLPVFEQNFQLNDSDFQLDF